MHGCSLPLVMHAGQDTIENGNQLTNKVAFTPPHHNHVEYEQNSW
jgi:hypothetical protein